MIRFHSPFDGKRLIGDRKKMIFHDSQYESMPGRTGGCQIDRIAREDVVKFETDSPAEALLQGFSPCLECLCPEEGARKCGG